LVYLDGAPRGGDERLDGGGVVPSRKLLLLRLAPLDDRHSQEILVHARVKVQDLKHLYSEGEGAEVSGRDGVEAQDLKHRQRTEACTGG
jgi:hypothetical protein